MSTAYQKAGVDVAAGDRLVEWLQESKTQPARAGAVVSGIGGFAALFRAQFGRMKSPLLVSSTDGVGTKVKLAADLKRFDGIGQDLVAMCANDLACVGADPLFFLDYYACGKLDLKSAKRFLAGVRAACDQIGCALIGGETAEMPGVYQKADFDCAGFVVGVVDEPDVLGAARVKAGDRLIGVASSGFHSNGYSLLRKVFARDLNQRADKKWAEILLRPTHLYSPLIADIKSRPNLYAQLHAVAHVTGGGFDNLLRVLPKGVALEINPWPIPNEFLEVKKRAKMKWPQLLRVLNCGVGLVLTVAADGFENLRARVEAAGFESFDLGQVVSAAKTNWHINGDLDTGAKGRVS